MERMDTTIETSADLPIVGTREISEMLSTSNARATQLVRSPGFPEPAYYLSAKRIWRTQDVVDWAISVGRDVRLPTMRLYAQPKPGRLLTP